MKFVVTTVAVSMLLGSMVQRRAWAATDTVLTGTVHDLRGLPLPGAVVELLAPDASVVARAVTDGRGHYLFHALQPGNYQVRATLAALLPALRSNLNVHTGSRAIADLTLAALFASDAWLPAERRTKAEPVDDWRWTLRSTANRPLLRLDVGDEKSETQSTSLERQRRSTARGQLSLVAGDGSFGEGGAHQVLLLDRDGGDGEGSVVRANLGAAPAVAAPSVTVDAGLQKEQTFGGGTRVLVSMASHPEVLSAAGAGMVTLRSATTEKLVFGDLVTADVGTLFTAEHLSVTRVRSSPYLRVALHPTPGVTLEYRFATDRALQGSDDLDEARLSSEAMTDRQGRPLLRKALHQELSASARTEETVVAVAIFQDALSASTTQGSGVLHSADFAESPLIADPITGTMHLTLPGLSGRGARVGFEQQLGSVFSASCEAEAGPAQRVDKEADSLDEVSKKVHSHLTGAVAGALLMTTRQTGTRLAISYRWQPLRSLTQVDEFGADAQQAYLGVKLRQKLWTGKRLREVTGTLDARNLLAEGYVPVLGADGQTLFLAQVPRALQAGLAFSF